MVSQKKTQTAEAHRQSQWINTGALKGNSQVENYQRDEDYLVSRDDRGRQKGEFMLVK